MSGTECTLMLQPEFKVEIEDYSIENQEDVPEWNECEELMCPVAVLVKPESEDGDEARVSPDKTFQGKEDPLALCNVAADGDRIKREGGTLSEDSSQVKVDPEDISCKTEPKEALTSEGEPSVEEQNVVQKSPCGKGQPGNCTEEGSCNASPSENFTLNRLPNRHSAEKSYECAVCSRRFMHKCSLNNHMRQCREQPRLRTLCKNRFRAKHQVAHQERSTTGDNPRCCSQCGKKLTHRHTCLRKARKMSKCSLCGKWLSRKEHLIRHMRTHTGEKPYECSQCGKTFSLKENLKNHIIILHSSVGSYLCSVCGKGFSKKSSLLKHSLLHDRVTPYICSVCNMSFIKKGCLNRHMLVHTREKSYECFECGKRFSRKDHLVSHIRMHTREKPFECSLCMKKFNDKQKLKLHIHSHGANSKS